MRGGGLALVGFGLAMSCGGTTTDVSRAVDPGTDAGASSSHVCTRARALSNSSQGNAFCVLTAGQSLSCWGNNGCRQLGLDATPFSTKPLAFDPKGDPGRFESVSVGWGTTCAVRSAGDILCWGASLPWGDPRCPASDEPTPVSVESGVPGPVAQVASGYDHACALGADGSVWCWGTNTNGQLGDLTQADHAAAAPVQALSSPATAVATGHSFSCAIARDGALFCWGLNYAGELGDGTHADRTSPVAVTNLSSGVVGVSLGNAHACAVTADGRAWCWGLNTTGQLGDGSFESSSFPVAVHLEGHILTISAGDAHTCALIADGGVWCWGRDVDGALGVDLSCDAAVCNNPTPTPVAGLPSDMTAVAAGYVSTCAMEENGSIWCWGGNDAGQLGDGTRLNRAVPARVLSCGG